MASREFHREFFHEPDFDDADMVREILSPTPDEEGLSPNKAPEKGELESLCSYPLLTKEQEKHLFRKLNCLKYLAYRANSDDERDDRIIQASWIRNIITKHNMRLIAYIVKPYARKTVPLMELLSEATVWMITGIIDSFDFRIDGSFSTWATGAIRKDIWNYLDKLKRRNRTVGDELVLNQIVDHRRGENDAHFLDDEFEKLREYIYCNVHDDIVLDILFRRLGLNNSQTQTFPEIGQAHKKSPTWVQNKFDEAMISLFGHTVNGNFIRSLVDRQKDGPKKPGWVRKKEA